MHTNPETKAKLQQFPNTQDQVKAVAKWWRSLNQEGKWLMQHEAKKFKSFPRTKKGKANARATQKKRIGPYQKFIQAYMKKKENAFLPPVLRFKRATEAYRLAAGGKGKKVAATKPKPKPAAARVGKKKAAMGKKATQPKKAVAKTARKGKK